MFFRLPVDAYRAHELWILDHRPALVIGTAAQVASSTHAQLAHHRHRVRPSQWSPVDEWPEGEGEDVGLMTTVRVAACAPASLRAYVVPAEWVLTGGAKSVDKTGAAL